MGAETDAAAGEPTKLEVLAFQLAGETYGLDIRELAEILLPRTPTPLPRTQPFLLGVLILRGEVLPVLDLAARLGLPPGTQSRASRILVVRDGEDRVGFRVDRVRGVVRFSNEEIETSSVATSVDPEYLQGIGYDPEGALVAMLCAENLCDFDPDPS